jgi:uncharacterized membrane protein
MNRRTFLAEAMTAASLALVAGFVTGTPASQSRDDRVSSEPSGTHTRLPSTTNEPSTTETAQPTSPGVTRALPPPPTIVQFSELSPESQREARIAIQKGKYESCDEQLALLDELDRLAPPSNRLIEYQGRLYRPVIMGGSGKDPEDGCGAPDYVLRIEGASGETSTRTTRTEQNGSG